MRVGSGMTPLHMDPAPGARALHFVGDVARFSLRMGTGRGRGGGGPFTDEPGPRAGGAGGDHPAFHRQAPIAGALARHPFWPFRDRLAAIETPLVETGFYKAKAYAPRSRRLPALAGGPGCRPEHSPRRLSHRQHDLLARSRACSARRETRSEPGGVARGSSPDGSPGLHRDPVLGQAFATWPARYPILSGRWAAASCICCR